MRNYGNILRHFNDVSFKFAQKLQKFVGNFEFFVFELRCSFDKFEKASFRFVYIFEVFISFRSLVSGYQISLANRKVQRRAVRKI